MLVYSMSVSADGFIADRDGGFDFATPSDELFEFHHAQVAELGGYVLGRRLQDAMLVWETDPAMRDTAEGAAFAEIWAALPKVVFSRTLRAPGGTARLATRPLAEEIASAVASTDRDVEIGGAGLAAQAIALDLVDDYRMFRHPTAVGGGTPYWPAVPRSLPLELVDTVTFGTGVIYERYRRARDRD